MEGKVHNFTIDIKGEFAADRIALIKIKMQDLEQYLYELVSFLMRWFAYAIGTHFSY